MNDLCGECFEVVWVGCYLFMMVGFVVDLIEEFVVVENCWIFGCVLSGYGKSGGV